MIGKSSTLLVLVIFCCNSIFSQILHTESFAVIIDTTKKVKGGIVPDFKYQNLKEDLIEFENTSDITKRFGNNAITFANKIVLSQYGKEVLLSGGFLYVEYRKIMKRKFVIEPYNLLIWTDARGLAFKYAGGFNFRYKIHTTPKLGLFAGSGPFYEKERWNYDGVKSDRLPINIEDITNEKFRWNTYVSLKWFTKYNLDLDISVYHQPAFEESIENARWASSTGIRYNFTEHLGLLLQYQNIYDPSPVVPIDKLYNKILFSVDISF